MTQKHLFKAGTYYVGDPCYSVKDDNWLPLLESTGYFSGDFNYDYPEDKMNYDDGVFTYNGKRCFASSAKYDDGSYKDSKGRIYAVDAELLSIMPWSCCDGDSMSGGNKVKINHNFYVWENDGNFYFDDQMIGK